MLGTNIWDHTSRGLKVSLHSLEVVFPSLAQETLKELVLKDQYRRILYLS